MKRDVYLYSGEMNPNDVRLRDITASTGVWASTLGNATTYQLGLMTVNPVTGAWASTLSNANDDFEGLEIFQGPWASTLGNATAAFVAVMHAQGIWASVLEDAYTLRLLNATANFIGTEEVLDRRGRRTQREQEIAAQKIKDEAAARRGGHETKPTSRLTGI